MSAVGWIGWILFTLMFILYWTYARFQMRKRFNVSGYVIYLLMSDTIREDHKRKFQDWIRETEAHDLMSFGQKAHDVIENMAGMTDLLAVTGMVWKYKAGEWEG